MKSKVLMVLIVLIKKITLVLPSAYQIIENNKIDLLAKLYILCIGSKSNHTI